MSAILHSITTSIENDRIKDSIKHWRSQITVINFDETIIEGYDEEPEYPRFALLLEGDENYSFDVNNKQMMIDFINNDLKTIIDDGRKDGLYREDVDLYWETMNFGVVDLHYVTTLYEAEEE